LMRSIGFELLILLLVTHDYDLDGKYIFNSNNSDTKIDYDKFIFQRIKYENNDDQNFLYQKIYKAKDKIINNSNPIDLIKRGFEYYLKEEPNFQYEDFHYITKKNLLKISLITRTLCIKDNIL